MKRSIMRNNIMMSIVMRKRNIMTSIMMSISPIITMSTTKNIMKNTMKNITPIKKIKNI